MASITTTTVRDATFDVLRERGLTTLFANPGSTEPASVTGSMSIAARLSRGTPSTALN